MPLQRYTHTFHTHTHTYTPLHLYLLITIETINYEKLLLGIEETSWKKQGLKIDFSE